MLKSIDKPSKICYNNQVSFQNESMCDSLLFQRREG